MTEETKNYMANFLNKVKPKDNNETQPIPINNENKKEDESKLKDYLETDVQTLLGIFDHYSKHKKRNKKYYSTSDSDSTNSDSSFSYSSDTSSSLSDSTELSDSSSSEESEIIKKKKIIKKVAKKNRKNKKAKEKVILPLENEDSIPNSPLIQGSVPMLAAGYLPPRRR